MNTLPNPLETAALVKQSQAGDLAAFEGLVTIYQHRVYSLACQLTKNSDDAQDLAQEAFIRAFRSMGSFRLESDFGTWLHRITVNIFLNSRKKKSNQESVSLDAPLQTGDGEVQREIAATTGDPLATVEQLEVRREIRDALSQLSEEHRAVLVLREIQEYSYEEIAQALGCTLGTVKSRLNRARKIMQSLLRR